MQVNFEATFQRLTDLFIARKSSTKTPEIQSPRFQHIKPLLMQGWCTTRILADESKCTLPHMWTLLSRLVSEGVVEQRYIKNSVIRKGRGRTPRQEWRLKA